MSYRLVCEAADVFVAAAGQAGTLGVDDCAPAAPISFLHIHGAADVNIPIDGGLSQGISGVTFPSPRTSIRTLAAADSCPGTARTARGRARDHRDVGTVRGRHDRRVRDGRGRGARMDGRGRADAARWPDAVRGVRQQRRGLVVPRRASAPVAAYGSKTAAPFTRSCARSASAASARSSGYGCVITVSCKPRRELQELFAVGAGVRGHAAQLPLLEQVPLVVQRRDVAQVDAGDGQRSTLVERFERDGNERAHRREEDRGVERFGRATVGRARPTRHRARVRALARLPTASTRARSRPASSRPARRGAQTRRSRRCRAGRRAAARPA